MGRLTFGMVGLLLLLLGAGGFLRNRILSGSPKGITKEDSALIADGLHEQIDGRCDGTCGGGRAKSGKLTTPISSGSHSMTARR
jgi:hypothetical protein